MLRGWTKAGFGKVAKKENGRAKVRSAKVRSVKVGSVKVGRGKDLANGGARHIEPSAVSGAGALIRGGFSRESGRGVKAGSPCSSVRHETLLDGAVGRFWTGGGLAGLQDGTSRQLGA